MLSAKHQPASVHIESAELFLASVCLKRDLVGDVFTLQPQTLIVGCELQSAHKGVVDVGNIIRIKVFLPVD